MRRIYLDPWEFSETGKDAWLPAQMPGCVHLDLFRHGLISDPHLAANEKECRWVDEGAWSYRSSLDWTPAPATHRRVVLFPVLDTICTVSLNGEKIGEHENMFVPLEIDVTDRLRPGRNEFRVDFKPASVSRVIRRKEFLAKEGLDADCAGFFERSFVRKAQYMFGWDWGPRLVSCGILAPPELLETQHYGAERDAQLSAPRVILSRKRDEFGESFEFLHDGKPLWIKGANWIPDHSFPSESTPQRLQERLEQARDLGINMLRVWGGGYYESDAFYDLCDRLGILVWQDFMFSCAYYPDEGEFAELVRREAEHQVKRLRHHPCIALWCGNNENQMMFAQKWGDKDKQPPRFYGEKLYNDVLRDVVQRFDPGRSYIEGSPIGGEDPNSGGVADQHFWDVWHGRGDWVHYIDSTARFCSEFGFASSPSIEVWNSCLPEEQRKLASDAMLWHDKTGKPWETFKGLVELHYPNSETLEDWVYYSQLNQRDAMREAIEHFRRSDFCRGTLVWQLNDCWPAQSWSLIDFGGRYKAAAYEMRRLYAPKLLSIRTSRGRAEVWAISDDELWQGEVVLTSHSISNADSKTLSSAPFRVQPGGRCAVLACELEALTPDSLLVAQSGEQRAWRLMCEPRDITVAPARITVRPAEGGIEVSARLPVVDLWLRDNMGEARFDDNFLLLLPREPRVVKTNCPVERLVLRSLAGKQ